MIKRYTSSEPAVTRIIIQLKSYAKSMLTPNGTMVIRLQRALDGCIQSNKLWHNNLCSVHYEDGVVMMPHDSCVLSKSVNGSQITVYFRVGDL